MVTNTKPSVTTLLIQTENEKLKDLYSAKLKNYKSDSGFDLYVPSKVTVPAKAIGFILDLEIKCAMKNTSFSLKRFTSSMAYADFTDEELEEMGKTREEASKPQYEWYEHPNFKPYMVFPRSSMGAKTPLRLGNSIGLIDKDYRGNIMVILDNLSEEDYVVEEGTRLAQIVSFNGEPFGFDLVEELNETERGSGGLGSTGV